MLEQIIVLEEPFPEEVETDVSDLPVRVSADESLHRVNDINKRIDLGYRAMTLKPAGKTLSLCFEMGLAAYKRNVPCYVADSSCIPVLVDWNKNVAARLGTLPELKVGMIESNGAQFYRNWENLLQQHPAHGAQWLRPRNGIFYLDNNFYKTSGGIF
jgi:L-alanine-DL-glutamate epimerase-like enolase superfamily enzyme